MPIYSDGVTRSESQEPAFHQFLRQFQSRHTDALIDALKWENFSLREQLNKGRGAKAKTLAAKGASA